MRESTSSSLVRRDTLERRRGKFAPEKPPLRDPACVGHGRDRSRNLSPFQRRALRRNKVPAPINFVSPTNLSWLRVWPRQREAKIIHGVARAQLLRPLQVLTTSSPRFVT